MDGVGAGESVSGGGAGGDPRVPGDGDGDGVFDTGDVGEGAGGDRRGPPETGEGEGEIWDEVRSAIEMMRTTMEITERASNDGGEESAIDARRADSCRSDAEKGDVPFRPATFIVGRRWSTVTSGIQLRRYRPDKEKDPMQQNIRPSGPLHDQNRSSLSRCKSHHHHKCPRPSVGTYIRCLLEGI